MRYLMNCGMENVEFNSFFNCLTILTNQPVVRNMT